MLRIVHRGRCLHQEAPPASLTPPALLMPSSRLSAAFARDTRQRHADAASPVRVAGTEGYGIYSVARFTRTLEEGGMKLDADCVVRLKKADWTIYTHAQAFDGQTVELWLNGAWSKFRATKPQDFHQTGEWKMELEPLY